MLTDPSILDAAYQCFLEEAPGLLETIERELFELSDSDTKVQDVNSIMRAAHTIKGGAANVGLDTINKIAHYLEDVFKALAHPEVEIDVETKSLLLEGYECLRLPLTAEFSQAQIDDSEILDRATSVFTSLNEKFGDYIQAAQDALPTSEDLGIDLVQTIFENVVPTHLDELAAVLDTDDIEKVSSKVEVFTGLAESLDLPGLGEIASSILAALEASPEAGLQAARIGLEDLRAAHSEVLSGDRERGGKPSQALVALATGATDTAAPVGEPALAGSGELGGPETQQLFPDIGWGDAEPSEVAAIESLIAEPSDGSAELFANSADNPFEGFGDDNFIAADNMAANPFEGFGDDNFIAADNTAVVVPEDAEAIAPEAVSLEGEPVFLDAGLQDNSLDSIWGGPLDLETSDLAEVVPERQTTAADASESALNLVDEAPNTPHLEIDAAVQNTDGLDVLPGQSELEAVFSANFEAEDDADSLVADEKDLATQLEAAFSGNDSPGASSAEKAAETDSTVSEQSTLAAEVKAPQALAREVPEQTPEKVSGREKQQRAKSAAKQTVRVNLEELESLNYLIGDLLIEQNKNLLTDGNIRDTIDRLEEELERGKEELSQAIGWIESRLPSGASDATRQASEGRGQQPASLPNLAASLPFETSSQSGSFEKAFARLKQAMGAVSKSVETLQKAKLLAKESQLALKKQQRTSLSMRDELLGSRMVTLESVLNRFPKMIQQFASAHGKQVELELRGSHILVDKVIEQKLYDPLLHLIRNAFDHGIETPEARHESGKREPAKIEVAAFHQGCQTIIEIRDNGRGIDPEKIRNRAIELGLVSARDASHLDEARVLEFLFEPGFSTASKVSELSGRGVGLDVVRSQIQSLNGSVLIESALSVGTTFTLHLPLTLNITRLMLCEAEGMTYSLLPDTIEKILVPGPDELKFHEGQRILHLESPSGIQTIPVRCLSELVSYVGCTRRLERRADKSSSPSVLLLRRKEGLLGLAIDRVLGEQELVIRPLGSALVPPPFIYGCSILPNGKLGLVVDPLTLMSGKPGDWVGEREAGQALLAGSEDSDLPLEVAASSSDVPSSANKAEQEQELLIVDDSPNARLSLSMSLEKAGYRVREAEDGIDALEKLKHLKNIGLILCDIDMPKMNGLEFLASLHKEPSIASIPVAMLTSHNSKKYRQLATQLGAVDYFAKPYKDEEVLPRIGKLLTV